MSLRSLSTVVSRALPVGLVLTALFALAPAAEAACGNGVVEVGEDCDDGSQNGGSNSCCTNGCDFSGESPDVIVGQLVGANTYGTSGGITAYSFGTTSCNIGSCWLNWFASTPEHPVIGQNMFRLKSGRFEQIGQAWLKHGFTALAENVCASCNEPPDGTHLGVNCSDPYSANNNGSQSRLGPKFEVNPATGVFPYPYTNSSGSGAIFKRLQVHNTDLDPALNAGALYFVEGQYVTHDDATAQNHTNNMSYRAATIGSAPNYTLSLSGSDSTATQRQKAGIQAWKAADPSVTQTTAPVPNDGFFILSAKATSLGGGVYHYEYAVQNLTSNRAAQSFTVPVPVAAVVTNLGFHDVDYHSGEPFAGTDWTPTVAGGSVSWATQTHAVNPNANALRWGTLYNFRFDANVAPATSSVVIGLFKPGSPTSVSVSTVTPASCSATETSCSNGLDDDCDGHTDCTDVDCCTSTACSAGDADGDDYAAVCDCNDANPAVYPGAPQLCDGLNDNCNAPGWPAVPANEADADGDGVRICAGDCDDANPERYPGHAETCDGINNDCAGGVPANEADADGDGVRICAGDCDDANPERYPGNPESCDGIDNDCAGGIPVNEADADGDGVRICAGDCDDASAQRYPGNPESCDGIDNDCAGGVPTSEADADGDGVRICAGDCDDASPQRYPGNPESCDGIDNDCAGGVPANEADADEDGVRICAGDCNDTSPRQYPGHPEVCDGVDNDCAGGVPASEADADGDGVRVCAGDCDDANPERYPGHAEVCDGIDNDCFGGIPASEADADGDGVRGCAGDCDDANPERYPGHAEVCDGVDNDCFGGIPANEADADGDGVRGCAGDCDDANPERYPGHAEVCDGMDNDCAEGIPANEADADGDGVRVCGADCDDGNPERYPGHPEICDGIDNDCASGIPANEADADGDGVRVCGADCDDGNPERYPGHPEICDGIDNDCASGIPANEADADGDGVRICGGDCDDADPQAYPGNPEICDGIDNDCDGDFHAIESDTDGDGVPGCDGDCDNFNSQRYAGNPEICDGFDNDCDGDVPVDEVDANEDGVLDCHPDCDPGDESVWATPGEVRNLVVTELDGVTTLTWTPPLNPGCTSPRYDTIRSQIPSDFIDAAECIETDGTDTLSVDGDTPQVGSVVFYLIRCVNDCPFGEGSLGTDLYFTPRTGRQCP